MIQDWPNTYRPDNPQAVELGKTEIAERMDALEEVRKMSVSLHQLAIDCLQDEPTARPSTVDLTKTLNKLSIQHPKTTEDIVSILEVRNYGYFYLYLMHMYQRGSYIHMVLTFVVCVSIA